MSEELKSMLNKTVWTFIEAFIGALTVAPLVGVDASAVQLAAMSGAGAALVVVKEFAKKQISTPAKSEQVMRNQIKIEGGGKGGEEPREVYEKNLGFITNTTVTHLGGPMSYKSMQEKFVFTAPIVAADVKPWNDRNTNNADTKLSKEKLYV